MRESVLPGSRVVLRVLLLCATPVFAQTLEPIRYTVSFPAPHTHYVEVEALVPTEGRVHVELMMAVWTPGSYMVREYARQVEGFTATDSARTVLSVEKTRKNRWRVTTGGAKTIRTHYRVYAHEMSVRTNWVDHEFALLNGAPTFITLLESPSRRAHEVRVVLPPACRKLLRDARARRREHVRGARLRHARRLPDSRGHTGRLRVCGRGSGTISSLRRARRQERLAGCAGSRDSRRGAARFWGQIRSIASIFSTSSAPR